MSRGRRGRRRGGGGGGGGEGGGGGGGGPQPGAPGPRTQAERAPSRPVDDELRSRAEAARAVAHAKPPVEVDDGPLPELPPEPAPAPRDADGEDVFLGQDEGPAPTGTLAQITGVRLREAGRVYEFDSGAQTYARGERVMVETDAGVALGTVALPSTRRMVHSMPRRILRRADVSDLRQAERSDEREQEVLRLARDRARQRRLEVQFARAEFAHGGAKATLYFSSEQRVDLRDLARDLSQDLRVRVDLRQVGARDAARIVGAVGDCGRELCCSTFLQRFEPISIRHAKEQNLPLNPAKLAGHCGRLKCCLVYEVANYTEARKGLPRTGATVSTPKGDGRVADLDILRRRIRVALFEGGFETFEADVLRPPAAPAGAPPGAAPPDPEPEPEGEGPPGLPQG